MFVMSQATQTTPTSPEQAILMALRQGGLNRGELSDLTGQPYALLVPALNILLIRGLIESYFKVEEGLPVLTYQLRSPQSTAGKPLPPPPPLNPRLKRNLPK